MHSVSVNLEPAQLLAGWRAEGRALFLPILSDARVGEQVAVRVGIFGQAIRATVFGKVAAVRRVGRPTLPPGVQLQVDAASVPAVGFLVMAARGEPVTFRERSPRFAVERTLACGYLGREVEASTINVSEGGCALRWKGPLPVVGEVVTVALPGVIFKATARSVVCWTQVDGGPMVGLQLPSKGEPALGLRVATSGRGGRAWRALVTEVAKSGARAA